MSPSTKRSPEQVALTVELASLIIAAKNLLTRLEYYRDDLERVDRDNASVAQG